MKEATNSFIPHGGGFQKPTEIVVHSMGEYIKDGDRPQHAVAFLNEYGLSAHALIAPSGDVFVCRADNEGAWHARGHNKNSLGIEFLVAGEHDYRSFVDTIKSPYLTDLQLEAGVDVCKRWMRKHDIKTISRHSDISPGRKVDPGSGFPWDYFLTLLGN